MRACQVPGWQAAGARADQALHVEEQCSFWERGTLLCRMLPPTSRGLLWTRPDGAAAAREADNKSFWATGSQEQSLGVSAGPPLSTEEEERQHKSLLSRSESELLSDPRPIPEAGGVHPARMWLCRLRKGSRESPSNHAVC